MEMQEAVRKCWTQACEKVEEMDYILPYVRAVPGPLASRPARLPSAEHPETLRMLVENNLGDYPGSKNATLASLLISMLVSWCTEERHLEYLSQMMGLSILQLEAWIGAVRVAAGGPPTILGVTQEIPHRPEVDIAHQLGQMRDHVQYLASMVENIAQQRVGGPPEGPGAQSYFQSLRAFDSMHYTDVRSLLQLLPAVGGFAPFKDGFTAKVYNSFNAGYLNFEAQSLLGSWGRC